MLNYLQKLLMILLVHVHTNCKVPEIKSFVANGKIWF